MLVTVDTSGLVLSQKLRSAVDLGQTYCRPHSGRWLTKVCSKQQGLVEADKIVKGARLVDERSKGGREAAEDRGEAAKRRPSRCAM